LNNEGKSIGQEHAAIEREKKEISQLAAVNPQDPNITVRNALIKQRLVEVQRRGKALGQQRAALKDRSATNTQVQGSETRQSGSQKQVKKENQPIPGLIGGPQQSGANTLPLGQKPRLLLPPAQSYTFGATHINSQDQTNGLQPKTATTESNPPNTFQSDLQIPTLAKLHHLGHKFTDFDSQLHNTSYLVENSAGDVHRGVLFLNRSLESVGKSVPTSLFGSKNPRRNITEQHGSDIEYNAEMHQQERQGKIHFQRPVVYEPVLMPPIPAWAPTLESRNILQPNPPQLKVEGASQKGEKRARHEDGQEEPAAKKIHHQPLSQQQDTVSSQRLQFKPCAHLSFDGLPSPPKGEVSYREIEKVVYYMPIKEGPEDASVFISGSLGIFTSRPNANSPQKQRSPPTASSL
jgi:hypothetical protein